MVKGGKVVCRVAEGKSGTVMKVFLSMTGWVNKERSRECLGYCIKPGKQTSESGLLRFDKDKSKSRRDQRARFFSFTIRTCDGDGMGRTRIFYRPGPEGGGFLVDAEYSYSTEVVGNAKFYFEVLRKYELEQMIGAGRLQHIPAKMSDGRAAV